ncbi:MAG: hypothetical protein KDA21_14225, partial [Phycisphaerales bacterium]|nr:hypothetical protein [Phycisphaerales bacterium]
MPHRVLNERGTPRISLRLRLTVWVVAIFLLIQIVTGGVFWLYQRSAILRVFQERLTERAEYMALVVRDMLPDVREEEIDELELRESENVQFEDVTVDVVDASGRSIVTDQEVWPRTVEAYAEPALADGRPRRGRMRDAYEFSESSAGQNAEVIAFPIVEEGLPRVALVVVSSDAFVVRQLALVTRALLIGGGFGLVASAVSGWLIAGMAVEPLRRLLKMASEFNPESIGRELAMESRSSEVAHLAAELEAARERIREAFAAQERFLSNISHEIKTPISTLLIEAQTLNRTGFPAEAVEFIETTEDEMRKLGKLVESFLMLTRMQDGPSPMRLRSYPANELVMDSVEHCSAMADQYGVTLEPVLAADEEALTAMLRGDHELLRTMLDNLVRNAIRFTPRGCRVQVSAAVEGDHFAITVLDEGPGIPPEMLDKIFNRFVRTPDEVSRVRGHGLGLAIAQGIAELHGGGITVCNRPER